AWSIWRSGVASRGTRASCSACSTCSTRSAATSTTSIDRGCRANRRTASTTSISIRRCRALSESASLSDSEGRSTWRSRSTGLQAGACAGRLFFRSTLPHMADIHVKATGASTYRVTVEEHGSRTEHEVTMTPEDIARYAPGIGPDRLLTASFEFLL